ncbi:hypothetical protein SAMN02745124_02936 [Desulfofustis glycolicus DSM 9705]|uniref:Uncharacterized protein n=1 Tax=Desulfofustis glycolicus DSM 9705 TaxID=1121409 RepID=A0A1M5XCL7_9BACT|nr:hypothetical protein SAMN02745124_02936 [Desulfofustis glycolicus DSM 9705]
MTDRIKTTDLVSPHDVLQMEILINQALIDLLLEKGVFTREELMAKIEDARKELLPNRRPSGNPVC